MGTKQHTVPNDLPHRSTREHDLFRLVIEQTADSVVITDPDGVIEYVNPAFERITGFTKEEAVGRTPRIVKSGKHSDSFYAAMWKSLSDGRSFRFEFTNRRKNGELYYDLQTITPIVGGGGRIAGYIAIGSDITEQKRDHELRERLAAIVDSADDAIISKSLDGTIVQWNAGAERLFGYTAEEMVGRSIMTIIPPDRREEEQLIIGRLKKGERIGNFETVRQRKDGTEIDVSLTISPIHDGHGVIVGASKIARDISARKRSEQQVRLQASILNQIHNAVISTTLSGHVRYWNNHASVMFGWTADEAMGRDPLDFIVQEGSKEAIRTFRTAVETEGTADGPVEFRHRNGAIVPAHAYFAPLYDSDGRLIGRNCVVVDLTTIRKAEEERRSAEERYQNTLENMAEGCQIIDFNFRYLYVNEVAAAHGRRTKEELTGRTMTEIYPGIDQTPMFAQLTRCMSERTVVRMNNQFFFEDGTSAWFDLRMEPVPEGVFILSLDITKEVQLHEELLQYRDHLQDLVSKRTEQLETVNKELEAFSYSVSHDLRAPLRAIDGFSRILREEYGTALDAEALRLIDVVCTNARTMGQLIDDLLRFSRTGRMELRTSTVDMTTLARSLAEELQQTDGRNSVSVIIGDLPDAKADPAMMKIVLTNLLSNAFKFTARQAAPRIEVNAYTDGNEQVYCIRDNGMGFDMRYVDKLFGVFQRLHRREEFEGTGIGLGIVKRIIIRHGGRVWATGEPGKGAAFYFSLPNTTEAAV